MFQLQTNLNWNSKDNQIYHRGKKQKNQIMFSSYKSGFALLTEMKIVRRDKIKFSLAIATNTSD